MRERNILSGAYLKVSSVLIMVLIIALPGFRAGALAAVLRPDLTIDSVWLGSCDGSSMRLYARISNNGTASSGSSMTLLSLHPGAPQACGVMAGGVPAGGSITVSCLIPVYVKDGIRSLYAKSDSTNIIAELDEYNNSASRNVRVTCGVRARDSMAVY